MLNKSFRDFQDSYLTCNRINSRFVTVLIIISGWEGHAKKDLRETIHMQPTYLLVSRGNSL